MIHLRKSNEALRSGSFTTVLTDDTKDCYVYLRSTQHQKILVLINNSPNPESITVENRILGTAAWTDLLSGNQVNGQEFRLLPTSAIVVGVSI
jgi:glycosidase